MLLIGRTVVITGAANVDGIGFATALRCACEGARVAILDVQETACAAAAAAICAEAGEERAIGLAADVCDRAALAEAAGRVGQIFGSLDVLMNNAGIAQKRRFEEITAEDWQRTIDVNLTGVLNCTQALLPMMRQGGSIINVASIAAQRGGGLLGGPHYAASKGGILALTKSMAREFGPRGIRANAINPGVIITGMNRKAFDDEVKRSLLANIPLARFGTPEDVAKVCLFLASDLSAYLTGTALDINGGMHIH